MPDLVYTRPYLYPKQEAAIFTDKRWALVEASTKSGKTVASIARLLEWGFLGSSGQNYWWVAPVSDQARIAFSRVKQNLTLGSFTSRESPTPSITLANGAILAFKSADNPDSLFGEDVYGVVIDEASRARPEAWHAIRSTLTATRGPAVLIGNVKGRKNWFYHFCRRAESGQEPNAQFSRIGWQDAVEAGVLDLEEIEDARRNLPEIVFRELYEAVAADDAGNPFGLEHIQACIGRLSKKPAVAFGIDLAKKQDWFVVIGLDSDGAVCVFERWQQIPWRDSIRRVHSIVGEDTPALVDSTGVGDPVLEELQAEHGNFVGYHFSSMSKQKLMEGLAVAIQSHEIRFPDGPIRNELENFEYVYTPSGFRYAAAEGYFDDCVCSLALAREQFATQAPAASLMTFFGNEYRRQQAVALAELEDDDSTRGEDGFASLSSPRPQKPSSSSLNNELTELYNSTLATYNPEAARCRRCGNELDPRERVTDGQFSWHSACAGLTATA